MRLTKARYRIECVVRSTSAAEHRRHLIRVGTIDADGVSRHWPDIASVRAAMLDGDEFFTNSRTGDRITPVEAHDCECGAETIRSSPAYVADKNLDNMDACTLSEQLT